MNARNCMSALLAFIVAVFVAGLLPLAALANLPSTIAPTPSRQAFYEHLAQVKEDMDESQVIALLGRPDFIGHFGSLKRYAVWFYSCTGSRQLATLATIYCDEKGRPVLPSFQDGSPPPATAISEPELRKAMLLLDRTIVPMFVLPLAFRTRRLRRETALR